jgi:hypothetical protein
MSTPSPLCASRLARNRKSGTYASSGVSSARAAARWFDSYTWYSRELTLILVSRIIVVAAAILFVCISKSTVAIANDHTGEAGSFEERFSNRDPQNVERPRLPLPELSINQEASRKEGEASPLSVTIVGSAVGASLIVNGLAPGTTLTVGDPMGSNGWRLRAADLRDALIRPPKGFAGRMELVLELQLSDQTVADRKSLYLNWTGAEAERSMHRPVRPLDREEIAYLIKRGQEFILAGDLASARLVLQRAAEAGDARAALMLAGTYDPAMLEKIGIQGFGPDIVRGFVPDPALARTWYQWAKEFGSTEAARRLDTLATPKDQSTSSR